MAVLKIVPLWSYQALEAICLIICNRLLGLMVWWTFWPAPAVAIGIANGLYLDAPTIFLFLAPPENRLLAIASCACGQKTALPRKFWMSVYGRWDAADPDASLVVSDITGVWRTM